MNKNFSLHKPNGVSSHSPNNESEGFIEYVSRKLEKKLWLCHRLDKETSGVILFAESKDASRIAYDLFFNHKVKKKYLFITDRKIEKENFTTKSQIKKKGNLYISLKDTNHNSETTFKLIDENKKYFLWQAEPLTGKTHQIRLHAKDFKIPILGDTLYGGSPFFRLMLHAKEIIVPFENEEKKFSSATPAYFKHLDLLNNNEICKLINSIDIRIKLFSNNNSFTNLPNSLRLIHTEHPYLRCDKLNDVLWFSCFHDTKTIEDILPLIFKLQKIYKFKKYFFRLMPNRGQDPNKILVAQIEGLPVKWEAQEEGLTFQIKTDSGTSAGIFLDQRQNRKWVYDNSKDKRVLNLYSYTSVFSICAALGGAKEVTSIDTSKKSLEWSKENFILNKLSPANYAFMSTDSIAFLRGAIRKKRLFDLIICDPPSFSRGKKGVFKIDKLFEELINLCYKCLDKRGILLFSSNYEKWGKKDFLKKIPKGLFQQLKCPVPDYDFELPGKTRILKTLLLQKSQKN